MHKLVDRVGTAPTTVRLKGAAFLVKLTIRKLVGPARIFTCNFFVKSEMI